MKKLIIVQHREMRKHIDQIGEEVSFLIAKQSFLISTNSRLVEYLRFHTDMMIRWCDPIRIPKIAAAKYIIGIMILLPIVWLDQNPFTLFLTSLWLIVCAVRSRFRKYDTDSCIFTKISTTKRQYMSRTFKENSYIITRESSSKEKTWKWRNVKNKSSVLPKTWVP